MGGMANLNFFKGFEYEPAEAAIVRVGCVCVCVCVCVKGVGC